MAMTSAKDFRWIYGQSIADLVPPVQAAVRAGAGHQERRARDIRGALNAHGIIEYLHLCKFNSQVHLASTTSSGVGQSPVHIPPNLLTRHHSW